MHAASSSQATYFGVGAHVSDVPASKRTYSRARWRGIPSDVAGIVPRARRRYSAGGGGTHVDWPAPTIVKPTFASRVTEMSVLGSYSVVFVGERPSEVNM